VNTRYALLGVDLRGIGYSSKLECSLTPSGSQNSALTKAQARQASPTTRTINTHHGRNARYSMASATGPARLACWSDRP